MDAAPDSPSSAIDPKEDHAQMQQPILRKMMGDCSTEGLVDIEQAEPGTDVMPDKDDDPG